MHLDETEVQAGVAEVQADVAEEEVVVAEVEVDVSEVEVGVAEVQTDVSEVQAEMAKVQANVAEVQANVAEVQTDVAELQDDMTKLEDDVAKIEAVVAKLEAAVAKLQADVAKVLADVAKVLAGAAKVRADEEVQADAAKVRADGKVQADVAEEQAVEVEAQAEGQQGQPLHKEISEDDLISETAEFFYVWNVGLISMYILQLHDFTHIELPDKFIEQYRNLAHILILETCSSRLEFLDIIRRSYPRDSTPESHQIFLRNTFVDIYRSFYIEHAKHIGFFCVWAFATELMIYLINNGKDRAFIRETILTLARMFNSREFQRRSSFSQFHHFADVNMRNPDRIEEWRNQRERLRNRSEVRFDLNFEQFQALVQK